MVMPFPIITPQLVQSATQTFQDMRLPEIKVMKRQIPQPKIDEYCKRFNYTDMPITPENTSKRMANASTLRGGLQTKSKGEQVYNALVAKISKSRTPLVGLDSKIFKDPDAAKSYQTTLNQHHKPGDKFSLTAFHQPGGKNIITFITNSATIGDGRLAELERRHALPQASKPESQPEEAEDVLSSAASASSSDASSIEETSVATRDPDNLFITRKEWAESPENPFRNKPKAPPVPDRSKKPKY